MPAIKILMDGDGAWPDLQEKREKNQLVHIHEPIQVARLREGMRSGKSSVSIRLDLHNGITIVAETSMELFLACAKAFQAREEAEGLHP